MSIAGNIYDLLTNISAISRETEWVYSTFSAPYILMPELNIAGKN
jgi:predicted Zn-dependent protease